MQPKVSVIIPAYNAENTIRECLLSVLNQNFKNFELIIVNDASHDKTYEIVCNLTKQFQNMKLINLNINSGAGSARNAGSEKASSELLAFLDSDCIAGPNWLESLSNEFSEENSAIVSQYNKSMTDKFIAKFAFYELCFRDKNLKELDTASSCNFICRRKDFIKIGGFSKDHLAEPAEDVDFFFRLSKFGKIKFSEEARVGHYFRDAMLGYFRQQKSYSRSAAYLFIKNYGKRFLRERTLHDKKNYFEILLTLLLPLFILISFVTGFRGVLVLYLGAISLLNYKFLFYLKNKENTLFLITSLPIIFVRNLYWSFGVIVGILQASVNKIFKSTINYASL